MTSNMRYFIYTFNEHKPPWDGSGIKRTIRVYRIKRGVPCFVGELTDTFTHAQQMLLQVLEIHKQLPSRCFERHNGSYKLTLWQLQEQGYATINPVV